jgi:hypothetical protein
MSPPSLRMDSWSDYGSASRRNASLRWRGAPDQFILTYSELS